MGPAGRPAEDPGTVALVATNGPRTIGGLAAYARHLGEELRRTGPVVDAVRFPDRARPSTAYADQPDVAERGTARDEEIVFGHSRFAVPFLGLVGPAMHRDALRPAAGALFERSLRTSLRRGLPARTSHVHWMGTGWELTGRAAEKAARRRGASFSVLPAIHPGAWGDSDFDIAFYRQADAVLAQSDHERALLIDRGVPEERVHRVSPGPSLRLDGDGDRLRRSLGLVEEPVVLFVGRREPYKGYPLLRAAFDAVWAQHPQARLLVCGPGASSPPERDPRVFDLGLVDEATKADAFAAADLFCLPSRYESFGLAYIEAWAYGLPVVGGDSPAVAELLVDGEDGIVISPTEANVARAVCALLGDRQLRSRLGAAGRRRQQAAFTWQAAGARHRSIFAGC